MTRQFTVWWKKIEGTSVKIRRPITYSTSDNVGAIRYYGHFGEKKRRRIVMGWWIKELWLGNWDVRAALLYVISSCLRVRCPARNPMVTQVVSGKNLKAVRLVSLNGVPAKCTRRNFPRLVVIFSFQPTRLHDHWHRFQAQESRTLLILTAI